MKNARMMMALLFVSAIATAGIVPRYSLTPGQVLTYEETWETNGETVKTQHEITVGRRYMNGSARVFLRTTRVKEDGTNYASLKQLNINAAGDKIELFPYGRNSLFFPRLPLGLNQMKNGWAEADPLFEGQYEYFQVKAVDPNDRLFHMTAKQTGKYWQNFKMDRSYEYSFDRWAGVMVSAKSGSRTIKLVSNVYRGRRYGWNYAARQNWYLDRSRAADSFMKQAMDKADVKLYETSLQTLEQALEVSKDEMLNEQLNQDLAMSKYRKTVLDVLVTAHEKLMKKTAPALKSYKGTAFDFSTHKGKVVVIDFWASWCGPCMIAMPKLIRLKKLFSTLPVQFLGINYDRKKENMDAAMKLYGVDYPNIMTRDFSQPFALRYLPTLYILDKEGNVRHIKIGAGRDMESKVNSLITGLLME